VTNAADGRGRPRVEGTGRLEAFSDGVFAIVVTLLILEVRLPEVEGGRVSFLTVAIYWVNHTTSLRA